MISTEIVFEPIGDHDDIRRRLSNTGLINRAMGNMLEEAARLGEQSAQIYAPEESRRIKRHISHTQARLQADGSYEAAVGVTPVRELAGGRSGPMREGEEFYPLYVHEGTGLYGRFHRVIRPTRRRVMRYVGRTGLVYAASVRGQRPQPFIEEAFEDLTAFIPQRLDEMVDRIFGNRV